MCLLSEVSGSGFGRMVLVLPEYSSGVGPFLLFYSSFLLPLYGPKCIFFFFFFLCREINWLS